MTRQAAVPELDLDGLDSVLGLRLDTVTTLFVTRAEKRLDPLSGTPKELAIMWLINANLGVN
ncbi:MAG: hypothetical protein B7X78_08370, partial [Sphingomonadales bacterium 39-62-4]